MLQIVNVLGFKLPFYKSSTLLLSLGLSIRVFWHLIMTRPDVIHVSSPGILVFAGILYAKLLDLPLVVSYHTHVPGMSAVFNDLTQPFVLKTNGRLHAAQEMPGPSLLHCVHPESIVDKAHHTHSLQFD